MRILLVDDHPLFMDGLKDLLTANDIEVTGTATNLRDAVRQVRATRPEVILMDVQMPGGDGIEATRLIKTEFPEIKIVMLTVSQDDKHLFEAIKAGASGYLLKGLPKEQFLTLLAGLSQGESPLSPGLAGKVLAEFARLQQERDLANMAAGKTALLSSQQIEILKLVAQGLTYKEIGGMVYLSEATVKYHMGEIMNRLHLENRSQVIAFAAELGLAARREK
ncbi:response regulator transcription factor [Propionispora vibrioides]|uniref:Two component transcriptional regulator, LuxR family n=1 Tax=Propionispora vibrioides TaxID=112903 RepID=A0A1H8UDS8_9FIRM|nr:response regulator transcription factor [Propionispora vibrioides]SEP01380.1 two component transcriptional regulator, LuxR family [Propionispora vibrioides]